MALTTYLAFDEVRAALGVNDLELKDVVLGLPVYEMGLVRELNKISTSLPAAFSTVSGIAGNLRTSTQEALYEAVHLFAVYSVSKQVGVSLATFAPKEIGDGKATLSRFSGTPYQETMERVEAAFGAYRSDLAEAYSAYLGGTVIDTGGPPTMFVAVKRLTDPVVGT